MKRYFGEFLGTFALVFCGTGAIIINQETGGGITHFGIAATFGLIVMAMIFALGDVSGAHLNPVVTIAFAIARNFPVGQIIPYFISQAAGAFAASCTLRLLFPDNEFLGATVPAGLPMQSFILEFVLTFLLVLVIFNVTTGSKEKGMTPAIAIGATVGLEAFFAGPICGASMNPIRSLSPALVSGHSEHIWIYILAPLFGAFLSIAAHQILYPKQNDTSHR